MGGRVRIDGAYALFEITGWDRLLSLKTRIKIPLNHITKVTTEEAEEITGFRLGGTAFPYMVKEGRNQWKSTGWQFYLMRDPDRCVSVYLKDEFYKRIVFEVPDKDASLKLITLAIREKVNTQF
ncbi:MAG: hypothetical protein KGH71_06540 [Candidatus Micrarchaeota archaeon]|nr:hypothetical protein [Candidatus Micrarchaeota archaeon]MDE1870591.1 hypothetical protein [Candidatus Micrarchaeota archaeon]